MKESKIVSFLVKICLVALVVIAVEVYISYNWLTVTEYEYPMEQLTDQVNLVVIADLHSNSFGTDNEKLVQLVKQGQPDAVLMDGDFLNKYDESHSHVVSLIDQLAEIAPVYYALGNHEIQYMELQGDRLIADIAGAGATLLDLEYRDIVLNGQSLRLGGMYDYAFALDGWNSTNPDNMDPQVYSFLCDFQDTDLPAIMLAHRPESFVLGQASVTWDVNLVISGHTHGGQVVVPFLGGLYASDQGLLPDYVYGLYTKDKIDILITRGLGSGFTWIPRFNNPPEVVLLKLVPEK